MARRLAATTALVLAALALSPAARAQGFFSFYELSPGDVLSRLDDQGYSPRIPMTRRGGVYIVDALMPSGRSVRLVVSAHDGRVLERYAVALRGAHDEVFARPRRRDEEPRRGRDDEEYDHGDRGAQAALGDPSRPRVLNFDSQNQDRMMPPASVPDVAPERSRHRVVRKPAASPVAKETPEPAIAAVSPAEPKPATPGIIDLPEAKAVAKPEIKVFPAPTTQAKVEGPKPESPRIVGEPMPQAKVEARPEAPKAVRESAPAQVKAEEKLKAEEKPKAETPRKKLNDLPVGTLD
jgi:hypothetical protein